MIDTSKFNSLRDVINTFSEEQTCIDHLTGLRWNGNIVSPFDPTSKVYVCKGNKYKCKNTGKYFNVRTQTLFDNTKIKLQKWFLAIYLDTSHKKGISSIQLSKDIAVTQKTAWFMLQRIRACFGISNDSDKLSNEVELDETFVGGKNKNRHASKKIKGSQGRSAKAKTPVVGMVEPGGKVVTRKIKDAKSYTLTPIIVENVSDKAKVYTDEWKGYSSLKRSYNHKYIKHAQGEYVNGKVLTNTIEGFWSLLKRGIIGIYHNVSEKHLQANVDEFAFGYNTRNIGEGVRINALLENLKVRTSYKTLIHG